MDALSSATTIQSSIFSESSKTGSSSKSGLGSAAADDKDRDYTKDNSASPVDLECFIQTERISKILDEAIYKTKLAICLPHLVSEYNILHSILTEQHMEDLLFIFEQYENPLFSASLLNMAAMEDIKGGDVSLKNRLNPELGHLIYIMNSYPTLKPKVEQMVDEMKTDYCKEYEDKEFIPSLEYVMTFEHFREQMVTQMTTTAAEELAAKIKTRKLENSNTDLLKKIDDYNVTIKAESDAFDATMKQKADLIAKLEQELAFLNHDANIKLRKKLLDSDRQMVLASRGHAVKNEMLKEEEVESREGYESLLRQHLIEEKNQRARRFKVETQLQSWLQKYDTEMGDKQVELDEFSQKFEEESDKIVDLEKKLAEQDKEYIPLMEEREKEYHEEMTAKMNAFLLEHSARVIQCAWRDVLANRAEKKRLKKLQKKMQAQAEAAARVAAAQAAAAARAARAAAKAEKEAAKAAAKAEKEARKEAKKNQGKGEPKEDKEEKEEEDED